MSIHKVIISSHLLKIETGRAEPTIKETNSKVSYTMPWRGGVTMCRYPSYYKIKGKSLSFGKKFGPHSHVIDYPNQRCLGLVKDAWIKVTQP